MVLRLGALTRARNVRVRTSARRALVKGVSLSRSVTPELMAHGGPTVDRQVSADLSTPPGRLKSGFGTTLSRLDVVVGYPQLALDG
eukprot:4684919-Amphidinium_carterae.3